MVVFGCFSFHEPQIFHYLFSWFTGPLKRLDSNQHAFVCLLLFSLTMHFSLSFLIVHSSTEKVGLKPTWLCLLASVLNKPCIFHYLFWWHTRPLKRLDSNQHGCVCLLLFSLTMHFSLFFLIAHSSTEKVGLKTSWLCLVASVFVHFLF